jgi:hypothetical protein
VCISLAALLTINKEIFLGIILFLVALFFLFISHQFPHFLSLPAKAWMWLGVMLGRFFNPITLGMLFFLLITPVGVLTRLFGRDELLLKKKNKLQNYSLNNLSILTLKITKLSLQRNLI